MAVRIRRTTPLTPSDYGACLICDGQAIAAEPEIGDAEVLWLRDQLGDDVVDMVVVTTGRFAYRRPDGVAVVPASPLGP